MSIKQKKKRKLTWIGQNEYVTHKYISTCYIYTYTVVVLIPVVQQKALIFCVGSFSRQTFFFPWEVTFKPLHMAPRLRISISGKGKKWEMFRNTNVSKYKYFYFWFVKPVLILSGSCGGVKQPEGKAYDVKECLLWPCQTYELTKRGDGSRVRSACFAFLMSRRFNTSEIQQENFLQGSGDVLLTRGSCILFSSPHKLWGSDWGC